MPDIDVKKKEVESDFLNKLINEPVNNIRTKDL